jgi:PadR family transcriptional regulator, regulatory protein AphA
MISSVSLRHAVLGLLAAQPATGYELAQKFERSLATAWHAGHSQIYPELAKLEEAGMAEVVGEGARRSRTFGITGKGREELRRWLVEVEPNRSQRTETGVRWFFFALLDPGDRRIAIQREIDFTEQYLANLQEVQGQLDALPGPHPFAGTVDLGQRTSGVMLEWLREQLAAIDAED